MSTRGLNLISQLLSVAAAILMSVIGLPCAFAAEELLHHEATENESCENSKTAILVNGLNANEKLIAPLAQSIEGAGFDVVPVVLEGHDKEIWGTPSLERWIEQVRQVRDKRCRENKVCAESTSTCKNSQAIVIGYSLGAVVALLTEIHYPRNDSNLILFAPPLRLTARASFARILMPLARFPFNYLKINVPTLAPKHLRAHDNVPLTVYREVFKGIGHLSSIDHRTLQNVNAAIFLTPKDELVSQSGVKLWIRRRALNWKIQSISLAKKDWSDCYSHLFVHPGCHSSKSWKDFTRRIQETIGRLGHPVQITQ